MAYYQTVALCNLFESLVVVGVASARVLDAVDMAVVMDHLVQERGADVFDRTGKRPCSDVDFVAVAGNRYPSIVTHGKVTVGAGCRLYRDGRPYK